MSNCDCYWIYILLVKNGTFYTGITTDLSRRYREHVRGTARCRYTRDFPPLRLLQSWKVHSSRGEALRIERFIKGKPKNVKANLVSDPETLTTLLDNGRITEARVEPCSPALLERINEENPRQREVKPGGLRNKF
jgi:putative endonuclease